MFSAQNITKLTVVGLAVGAFAAPAASAMPFGGIPSQASAAQRAPATPQANYLAQARQLKAGSARLYYRNVTAKQLAADLAKSPNATPVTVPVAVRHANPSSTGNDWAYAGIGAGGAMVLVLLAIGGPLALQRRRPEPTAIATS